MVDRIVGVAVAEEWHVARGERQEDDKGDNKGDDNDADDDETDGDDDEWWGCPPNSGAVESEVASWPLSDGVSSEAAEEPDERCPEFGKGEG
mmetsp:Transcript_30731/g.59947  ORF Transcript_30731/g.59947 Transcript_30731/m.59947 type:complete len:92 (+) Transcript_30731:591-866(+)